MSPELSFDATEFIDRYKPDYAMAYGSGVFKQEGHSEGEKPMVDIVLAVEDTAQWHAENLLTNPRDYSAFVRLAGPRFAEWLQQKGAGIYYNPFIKLGDTTIKYGVMNTSDLVSDLMGWETLYVAGRMHKPVKTFKHNGAVEAAMDENFKHAVQAALLLLPEQFTLEELFMTICGLSYTGDTRMGIAEDPNKVKNIVRGSMQEFFDIYAPLLTNKPDLEMLNGEKVEQDKDPKTTERHWGKLPYNLTRPLAKPPNFADIATYQAILRQTIANTVRGNSLSQTIKGAVTAGAWRSLKYGSAKLLKRFR